MTQQGPAWLRFVYRPHDRPIHPDNRNLTLWDQILAQDLWVQEMTWLCSRGGWRDVGCAEGASSMQSWLLYWAAGWRASRGDRLLAFGSEQGQGTRNWDNSWFVSPLRPAVVSGGEITAWYMLLCSIILKLKTRLKIKKGRLLPFHTQGLEKMFVIVHSSAAESGEAGGCRGHTSTPRVLLGSSFLNVSLWLRFRKWDGRGQLPPEFPGLSFSLVGVDPCSFTDVCAHFSDCDSDLSLSIFPGKWADTHLQGQHWSLHSRRSQRKCELQWDSPWEKEMAQKAGEHLLHLGGSASIPRHCMVPQSPLRIIPGHRVGRIPWVPPIVAPKQTYKKEITPSGDEQHPKGCWECSPKGLLGVFLTLINIHGR